MRNTAIQEIERLAEQDMRICLITGDLGYGVLESFAKKFPERYFNMGISEQSMTAAAAGMALCGSIVFTYSIGNFNTLRCIEQIRNDICYHNANVKIISVGSGFSYGQLGMSHHATEDVAMLRALPNMRVFVPADPEEALLAVNYAAKIETPCYIRLAKKGEPICYTKGPNISIDKLQEVFSGKDIALLLCGPVLKEGIAAAKQLSTAGISAAVYSAPCIKPLDQEKVHQLAKDYPLLVTVEEHQVTGGLGGAVAEIVGELQKPCARVYRMGLQDTYTDIVGTHDYLCEHYGLSSSKITEKVLEIFSK